VNALLDDFLVRAALAALGTALAAGLLGCFVVWRRMAYFGDATSHAAILGVAASLALDLPPTAGVLPVAAAMALLVALLAGRRLGADTVLGVLAYGSLGLGLLVATLLPGPRMDLEAWLIGDVLTVSRADLVLIWGGLGVVAAVLWALWPSLLTATLSPEMAHAAGIEPWRGKVALALLLACVVAAAIQVVGALLVMALLVIPAAAARPWARTPEGMAALACAVGATAALGGLWLAVRIDAGVGPAIVAVAVAAFALSTVAGRLLRG
jgi:zinc transport system permease protein